MSFYVNDMIKQCCGTLVNVLADNPAACSLGGFKQLHSQPLGSADTAWQRKMTYKQKYLADNIT